MSWPVGIDEIKTLLAQRDLEQVQPNLDGAEAFLRAAALHLNSALALADGDPEGAYTMLYDAARKSLVAVLLTQGLRPTTSGGHRAVQDAINAQFTKPPPKDAFRPFARIRRTRNQTEYEHLTVIDAETVYADHAQVLKLHEIASQLVPQLPVFTG